MNKVAVKFENEIINTMIECLNDDVCLVVTNKAANEIFDAMEDLEIDHDDYSMTSHNKLVTIWRV